MEVHDYLGNPLVWLLLFLEVIIAYNFASFDVNILVPYNFTSFDVNFNVLALGLKIMLVRGCKNVACKLR